MTAKEIAQLRSYYITKISEYPIFTGSNVRDVLIMEIRFHTTIEGLETLPDIEVVRCGIINGASFKRVASPKPIELFCQRGGVLLL